MYKNRLILSGTLALLICLLAACRADPKEIICRKWTPVDAFGNSISDNLKTDILREGNMIEFTPSGECISYTMDETSQKGHYSMNEEATTLHISIGDAMETQMNIKALSRRKLILESRGVTIIYEAIK